MMAFTGVDLVDDPIHEARHAVGPAAVINAWKDQLDDLGAAPEFFRHTQASRRDQPVSAPAKFALIPALDFSSGRGRCNQVRAYPRVVETEKVPGTLSVP